MARDGTSDRIDRDGASRGRRGLLAAPLAALIGEPLALPRELLETYPELAGARFRRGGLPPRVGGWALGQRTVAAITLWHTVFLAPRVPLEPALLLHELRHVHHFQASAAFPARYIWESLRRGYRGNRYEADADAYAFARLVPGSLHRPPTQDV